MRHHLLASCLMAGLAIAAGSASATTLLDLVDAPDQTTTYDLAFTAARPETTIFFAGYDVPYYVTAYDIQVLKQDAGPNHLNGGWAFTPAPDGSDTFLVSDGTPIPALVFGSVVEGAYDVYSENISTVAGAVYNVDFSLNVAGSPNGFKVTETPAAVGSVPEPASWSLMIMGMACLGASMRRRRLAVAAA